MSAVFSLWCPCFPAHLHQSLAPHLSPLLHYGNWGHDSCQAVSFFSFTFSLSHNSFSPPLPFHGDYCSQWRVRGNWSTFSSDRSNIKICTSNALCTILPSWDWNICTVEAYVLGSNGTKSLCWNNNKWPDPTSWGWGLILFTNLYQVRYFMKVLDWGRGGAGRNKTKHCKTGRLIVVYSLWQ